MDNTNGGINENGMQFFTADTSGNPEAENLNLPNWQPEIPAPEAPSTPEYQNESHETHQKIGNQAMSAPDITPGQDTTELGKVVNISMPKDTVVEGPENEFDDKDTGLLADGKLSKSEIGILKQHENKLSQDGNISEFYDYISKVRQTYLDKEAS